MRIKICGITRLDQASAIAQLGATALGFICVPSSKRYISPPAIRQIVDFLPPQLAKIGVFANATRSEILETVAESGLTGVQLHGDETPEFCQQLQNQLPGEIELIKALRVQSSQTLETAETYFSKVNSLLLDAYHPQLLGGTGQTLDWQALKAFQPPCDWFLAGGLTPENIQTALAQLHPDGIDLSSGVERSPGDKDLEKVETLLTQLATIQSLVPAAPQSL